jgi:hypothetical protein
MKHAAGIAAQSGFAKREGLPQRPAPVAQAFLIINALKIFS